MPALADKLKDMKKAVDAAADEVKTTEKAFTDKKKEAEGLDFDPTDPDDATFKALEEALRPHSEAKQKHAVLNDQFQKLALMVADDPSSKAVAKELGVEFSTHVKDISASERPERYDLERQVMENERYKALREDGTFNSKREFKELELTEPMSQSFFKSLITGRRSDIAVADAQPERLPGIDRLPWAVLGIEDLISIGTTDSDSIEYIRMFARTIAAKVVPEAQTDAPIGSGAGTAEDPLVTARMAGLKPQSDWRLEKKTEAVKNIAHWVALSRKSMNDRGQVVSVINDDLLFGIRQFVGMEVMAGDGTEDHLRGIYHTTGKGLYVQGTRDPDENKMDAIHRAITINSLLGLPATAVGMNDLEWEDIRLTKDPVNGGYLFGPPSQVGPKVIWGVPVATGIAFQDGRPVVGQWNRYQLSVRRPPRILASDSHADFFVRNLVALLAEGEYVGYTRRPEAFTEVETD